MTVQGAGELTNQSTPLKKARNICDNPLDMSVLLGQPSETR